MKVDRECLRLWERGTELSEDGRHEEAIDAFTEAIDKQPDWLLPFFWRAGELEELGRSVEAVADFTRYIECATDAPVGLLAEAHAGRAYNLKLQGDFHRALEDYSTELELNPNSAIGYLDRSLVFDQLGEFESATADYQRALELDPSIGQRVEGGGPIDWRRRKRRENG